MPRRILDVSGKNEDKIRLFDTTPSTRSQYAALSYCWGTDRDSVYATTAENIEKNRHSIDPQVLPKTIQDAVTVCKGLGIPYLWVDALCIVQNDEDDWRRESVQMCSIYGNAFITIAANPGASCNDGFLGAQVFGQPQWQRPFLVEFDGTRQHARGTATEYAGRAVDTSASKCLKMHLRVQNTRDWFSKPSPLMCRGWTLQESFLSRRIVHYTGAELLWECEEKFFCECGHVYWDSTDKDPTIKSFVSRNLSSLDTFGGALPMGVWMRLVEQYSTRKLTKSSDKLVAISGIAQSIASTVSDLQVSFSYINPE